MKLFTNTLTNYKQKKKHTTTLYKLDWTNATETQLIYSKVYIKLLFSKTVLTENQYAVKMLCL